VAVAAEGYTPELAQAELVSGELTEIEVSLSPLLYSNVNIGVPGFNGVSLYQGALYIGEAPYNLQMPIDSLGYVTAEARGGQQAQIVFPTPDMPDESYNFSLKLRTPPPSGQKRVNNARMNYYWAWGATWLAAMLAWGTNGVFTSYNDVMSNSSSQEFLDGTITWNYINLGSLVLLGAAAAYNIYQLSRYLYVSTEGATPIAKQEKK
jgi:hypothetical protein